MEKINCNVCGNEITGEWYVISKQGFKCHLKDCFEKHKKHVKGQPSLFKRKDL